MPNEDDTFNEDQSIQTEDTEQQENELMKQIENINFWIGNCDTKVSFSLAFTGILFGGFLTSSIVTGSLIVLLNELTNLDSANSYWGTKLLEFTALVLVAFLITMILSTLKLFGALRGSINPEIYSQDGLKTNSNLFFGSIASKTFNSFKSNMTQQNRKDKIDDYLSQIYINSKICTKKFQLYNSGIKYLQFSIILFILLNLLFLLF